MARSRSTQGSQPRRPMAEWERELLGYSSPGSKLSRLQRIAEENRARRMAPARSVRRHRAKPKTAADASYSKQRAELHRRGRLTASGKPRKSRRAIKRELYGPAGSED